MHNCVQQIDIFMYQRQNVFSTPRGKSGGNVDGIPGRFCMVNWQEGSKTQQIHGDMQVLWLVRLTP